MHLSAGKLENKRYVLIIPMRFLLGTLHSHIWCLDILSLQLRLPVNLLYILDTFTPVSAVRSVCFIGKYELDWLNDWQTFLPGCLCSLHYWMVGEAGWPVEWVMIEHAACQPPWLANWLTNWLPAWLNDDLTYNLPLFPPAGRHSL